MEDVLARVVYQESLGGDYFRIGLNTGYSGFSPGQFGMLEVPRVEGILLRRPFSFARQEGPITEILYKVVGKGTHALSQVPVGGSLALLGPLGKGFTIPSGKKYLAVAGGYGVAPFLEMASQLKKQDKKFTLFYGARRAADLIYLEEFSKLEVELYLSTEDGSRGRRGRITELLSKQFNLPGIPLIWSCGPSGLLRAVQTWAKSEGIPCELSVEEAMGCGTGVCLGCVVSDRHGHFIRTCLEGPVFRGEELELAP